MMGIMDMVKKVESKIKGVYVMEDAQGKEYIYREQTDDLHMANNLELDFYKPKSRYAIRDYEVDNWKAW